MKQFTPLLRNKKTKILKKRNNLLKKNHKNKKGKNQMKKKAKKSLKKKKMINKETQSLKWTQVWMILRHSSRMMCLLMPNSYKITVMKSLKLRTQTPFP